jgi:hypothetical protein
MRFAKLSALVAATLLLAGCALLPFGGGPNPNGGGSDGSGGSGETSEGPTPGDQGGDADDDTPAVGSGRLPASWPDSIYVPDAPISSSIESPGSWVVVIDVDDPAAAFADIAAHLKASGYTAVTESVGESSIGIYDNGEFQVNVLANDDSGTPSVTYAVVGKG